MSVENIDKKFWSSHEVVHLDIHVEVELEVWNTFMEILFHIYTKFTPLNGNTSKSQLHLICNDLYWENTVCDSCARTLNSLTQVSFKQLETHQISTWISKCCAVISKQRMPI